MSAILPAAMLRLAALPMAATTRKTIKRGMLGVTEVTTVATRKRMFAARKHFFLPITSDRGDQKRGKEP